MSDIERKVLTIVGFINAKGRNATFNELMRKTGRNEKGLSEVLESLLEQNYIYWDIENTNEVIIRK